MTWLGWIVGAGRGRQAVCGEAGRAGGMKVVAVATTHSIESLQGADRAVENLETVPLELLASLFS